MAAVLDALIAALADRYRIERELGAGGMATVYLAHDVRHDRKVAVKVLLPELSAVLGADRFLAEIKTTANLQHPHILPLHDSGEAAGLVFYVMPFIEGESLRDHLRRDRQLPLDEAIRITREIADALDYAHRRGVIHRDIKPENILLHDGHVSVADFGIALAASRTDGGSRLTETGMSLGTPQYMSPEQAMGERDLTPKADVYALGCVLYEMLTGEPPFTGPTAQAIIAKVVTTAPTPPSLARHTIPAHVEQAVLTALEKVPADRFPMAGDFVEALAGRRLPTVAVRRAYHVAPRRPALGLAFAIATLIAVPLAIWGWLRRPPPAPVARYVTDFSSAGAPSGLTLRSQTAIAPDGSFIVYRDTVGGGPQLFIRRRDELVAQPISGTEQGNGPFVSPDGAWIGFFARGELRKVPSRRGGALTLADSVSMTFVQGTWADDGTIYFSDVPNLRRVNEAGGDDPVVVSNAALGGRVGLDPEALPGGRGVLFTACSINCNTSAVYVYDARADTARLLFDDALGAWFARTGHLLHLTRGGTLLASPWSTSAAAPAGLPVPVLDGIQAPGFLLARDGTALYVLGPPTFATGPQPNSAAVWVDQTGRTEPIDTAWRFNTGPANWGLSLSPDGRRLAIRLGTALGDDIWIKQLPRGPVSRLTFHDAEDRSPRWTPDGRSIVFVSRRPVGTDTALAEFDLNVWTQPADGTGEATLLWNDSLPISDAFWSPDGQWLVMRSAEAPGVPGGRDILAVRPGRDSVARRLMATQHEEQGPAISPDSRWIAYVSNETGRNEVFIRPFPDVGRGKWQVSSNGGNAPVWAHNGRDLFYLGAGTMNQVTIQPGPPFSVSQSRELFPRPTQVRGGSVAETYWAISPDDRRFLMVGPAAEPADSSQPLRLVLVHNFLTELEAKLQRR